MIPILFALAAGLTDLVAGALTLRGALARLQSRYVIAFGAGVLLAATFFNILPEVQIKTDAAWLAAGFVAFYLLEKSRCCTRAAKRNAKRITSDRAR